VHHPREQKSRQKLVAQRVRWRARLAMAEQSLTED
jgi:hypothetical protein